MEPAEDYSLSNLPVSVCSEWHIVCSLLWPCLNPLGCGNHNPWFPAFYPTLLQWYAWFSMYSRFNILKWVVDRISSSHCLSLQMSKFYALVFQACTLSCIEYMYVAYAAEKYLSHQTWYFWNDCSGSIWQISLFVHINWCI